MTTDTHAPDGAQQFTNGTTASPALAVALRLEVEWLARRAFEAEGTQTFIGTRRAAAFHEAGHVVAYADAGLSVSSATIFPTSAVPFAGLTWCGFTDAGGPWQVSWDTDPLDDLARARITLSGSVGELLAEGPAYRAGSSLDELALARAIVWIAAGKLRVDVQPLLIEQANQTRELLRSRWAEVETIAAALMCRRRISGRRLAAIMRKAGQ